MSAQPSAVPRSRFALARDEFYIGYGKMPPGLRWFTLCVGVALVFATAGFSLATFLGQAPPPAAGFGPRAKLEGIYQARPYPMLHVSPGVETHGGKTVILVRPGKSGVSKSKSEALDGKAVQVGGVFVRRAGVQVFQVAGGGDNALRAADASAAASALPTWEAGAVEDLGAHRLKGAIVDPKCFSGAMLPGNGKAHKGCATFCLLSNLPPVFVSRRPFGGFSYYLVTSDDGSPLGESWYRYVSDPIAITGRVERVGGLLVIKVDSNSVERI